MRFLKGLCISIPILFLLINSALAQGYRKTAFDFEGSLGSGFLISGNAMIPISLKPNRIFYTDLKERYGVDSKTSSTSLAVGYRQINNIFHKNVILGAYIFADRSVTKENHKYYLINPGIELIGKKAKFIANAYIPIGKKEWTEATGWADELGYYGYSSFSDHTMYDDEITLYDKIGWGADAGISFNIPLFFKQKSSPLAYKILKNKLKFFIGGFFFNQSQKAQNATFTFNKIKSTQGISTELSYDITRHITFEVKDNYDNQMHNTIMTGIRATFGGIKDNKNTENSVYSKLLCPIVNNIGNILSGTVEPTKKKSISIIRRGIELNNVYFFGKETPSDTSNGSYENPYSASELTQSTLTELSNSNAINSQVNIFLLSGKNYINAKDLVLAKNESIYGRCNNFKEASSDNSPIIYGQLTLKGGSYSHTQVVQGIHMKNNGNTSNSGIKIDGENISNIKIDDVKIGMNSTTSNYYTYTTGILVENGANLSKGISNSTIWATGDSVASDFGITAGIEVKNASVGDIKNNTISIGTYDCNANLWGIYLEDNSSKNMNIGNITDNNITVNTDKYVYYNNSNRGIYANAETETSNNVELNIGDIEENKISIKEPTSEEYKRYNNDGMQFDGNATNGKAYINVGNIINNNINVAYASSNGWSDDITAYANSKNTYITVGNILNNEIKGNGDGIRNINSKIDNSESSIVNQNNFTGNFKKIYSTT